MNIAGMEIIESNHLTVTVDVKRTWRERLFSRPWRPWIAWEPVQVPDPRYYIINGRNLLPDMVHLINLFEPASVVVAHPQTVNELRRTVQEGEGT